MTDRYEGFMVVLAKDTRDDDAAPIMEAIRMIKGVIDVRPITADYSGAAAIRADMQWKDALYNLARTGPAR